MIRIVTTRLYSPKWRRQFIQPSLSTAAACAKGTQMVYERPGDLRPRQRPP